MLSQSVNNKESLTAIIFLNVFLIQKLQCRACKTETKSAGVCACINIGIKGLAFRNDLKQFSYV